MKLLVNADDVIQVKKFMRYTWFHGFVCGVLITMGLMIIGAIVIGE